MAPSGYGSVFTPSSPGSAGFPLLLSNNESAGGAALFIFSQNCTIDGAIHMDGSGCSLSGCGAGSGGSILIQTGKFAGHGVITANGGNATIDMNDGAESGGGGGGGGRISIIISELYSFNGFVSAYGGSGRFNGGAGTINRLDVSGPRYIFLYIIFIP